jgi:hypothetical protein
MNLYCDHCESTQHSTRYHFIEVQEERDSLAEKVKELTESRQSVFEISAHYAEKLAAAEKVIEAARFAGCYCDGLHEECSVGFALAQYDSMKGKS